jgi:hypothetical protein
VDLDEILYVGNDIEDDLESILLNPVASTIPKYSTFKLLRWVLLLKRLVELDYILYGDDDIEGDFDSILINPVDSTIPK